MFDDRHDEFESRWSWPLATLLLIALIGLTLTSEDQAVPDARMMQSHFVDLS